MATKRVEGYETDEAAQYGGQGAVSWIDPVRSDLRREMIVELARKRIRDGYWAEPPDPHGLSDTDASGNPATTTSPQEDSRALRIFEGVLIGVAVTVLSAWLCSAWSLNKKDRK